MKKKIKIALLITAVATVTMLAGNITSAFAFWPATHQQVAQEELLPYINGGAIAPDWCVAYDKAIGDKEIASHHEDFHSDAYVKMLRLLAKDKERVFVEAYASHIEADKIPDGTDKSRGESYIILCPELMVRAYGYTFPKSEWQPAVDEIEALYLANIAYQSILPEVTVLSDFDNLSQLKDFVKYYRENDYVYQPSCIYHAQYFSWYAGQSGYNISWVKITKSDYNRLFDKITFPSDKEIPNHYICLTLVGKYEYLIEPQTGEIVKTGDWAVGK